ncbi:hypothetical protein G6F46_014046 [Rhizopus delemar]|nr:hypothetical protein G6F46_014046 [Rhizopus delemar]
MHLIAVRPARRSEESAAARAQPRSRQSTPRRCSPAPSLASVAGAAGCRPATPTLPPAPWSAKRSSPRGAAADRQDAAVRRARADRPVRQR